MLGFKNIGVGCNTYTLSKGVWMPPPGSAFIVETIDGVTYYLTEIVGGVTYYLTEAV